MVLERDTHPAASGDHGVGTEAAVGPRRELPLGPSMAHPSHGLPQEVGGAAGGVGPALVQPGQQRVIAPLAGVAMVACALLGQTVAILCPCPACAEATNR